MIEGLRAYPEITLSGADWLPGLPRHWELHRAKANFREVDERSLTGDEELLSVSHKTGVTPRSQKNVTMFMAESYEGHKTCQPGDIVVNTLWAWMAALGASKHVGIISPAYGVYRQRAEAFDPRYLDYLLRTETYRGEYLRSSRGITTSRLRLYPPDFLNIPFVQPPLDEQRLIVRFLDWHGAMTTKLIRAKRGLTALLNEQKQSIIQRAVTRGLNPAAKLKSSGLDWLGDVPEHWEVLPFHSCYAEKSAPNIGMLESMVLSLSYGRIVIKPPEKLFGLVPASFETYQIVDPGDIIIRCTDLQNDKKSLRTGLSNHRGIITSAYLCLKPKNTLSCEFAHLVLATYDALKIIYGYGSGLRQNLSFKDLKHMPIPVPPREEQPQIIAEIQRQTATIEQAIQQCSNEIALVAELRTRLIADVVTGQLDVRAVAASLPEVAEADAAGDLTDENDLDEDVDAEALADEEKAA